MLSAVNLCNFFFDKNVGPGLMQKVKRDVYNVYLSVKAYFLITE